MAFLGSRSVVVLAVCLLEFHFTPAIAGPPEPASAPTSEAEAKAARRRMQLAAPVATAARSLAAVQKSVGTRPTVQWKQVTSKPGEFAVSFPGAPKEHSIPSDADSELGPGVAYELVLAPDQVYVAGSAEIRGLKSPVDDALADAIQGAAEQLHGTLKNVVRLVDGSPAIQGRITLQNGAIVVVEFTAVDHRLYCVAAGDRSGDGIDDTERFVAGFAPTIRPTATARPIEFAQVTAIDPDSPLPPAIIDFARPTISGSLEAIVITRYLKRNSEKLCNVPSPSRHSCARDSGSASTRVLLVHAARASAPRRSARRSMGVCQLSA